MSTPREKNHELKKHLTFKDGSLLNSSRKLGISYDRLIAIIAGRTPPSHIDIKLVSKHLALPADQLFHYPKKVAGGEG